MKLVTESKVIINKENFVSLKNPKCRTELKRAFGKELQNLHKQSPEKKTESSTRKKTEKTQKEKEKVRTRANTEGVRVTQYESIIFNFLKEKQKLKQKDSNYLSKQKDINEIMRSILVDWLVDVTEKFQMNPQTLFMSIDLLDRYLSLKEISRSKLQLLGICCLMIVGKYEEIYPPLLKDYLSVCDNAFQRNEILAMEAEILVTVNFDLNRTTSLVFLEHIEEIVKLEKKPFYFIKYLLENALLSYKVMKFNSLELVVGGVFLVKKIFKIGDWDQNLGDITGVTEMQAKICARDLYIMMKELESGELSAIQRKFSQPEFLEVSKYKIEKKNN